MLRIGFSPSDIIPPSKEISGVEFADQAFGVVRDVVKDLAYWRDKKCSVCGASLNQGGILDIEGKSGRGRGAPLCYADAKKIGIDIISPTSSSTHFSKKSQQESARSRFEKMRQKPEKQEVERIENKEPTWWESFMGGLRAGAGGNKIDYEAWKANRHKIKPKRYFEHGNWLQRLIGD